MARPSASATTARCPSPCAVCSDPTCSRLAQPRWWTRRLALADVVIPGVLLGRLPAAADLQRLPIAAIVDVCAELPCPTPAWRYAACRCSICWPDDRQIERALAALQQALAAGPVLVCCALGLARSALVVAAWLLRSGRTTTPVKPWRWCEARPASGRSARGRSPPLPTGSAGSRQYPVATIDGAAARHGLARHRPAAATAR
jgi:hypothetical protein